MEYAWISPSSVTALWRRRWLVPRSLMTVPRRPTGSFRITGLCLIVGLVTGLLVVVIKWLVTQLQHASLSYVADESLAVGGAASFPRTATALCVGAVIVTALTYWLEGPGQRSASGSPIDAVEANALRGGLMHARDGVSVVTPILGSVGFGASVGIEAAVTQAGRSSRASLASTEPCLVRTCACSWLRVQQRRSRRLTMHRSRHALRLRTRPWDIRHTHARAGRACRYRGITTGTGDRRRGRAAALPMTTEVYWPTTPWLCSSGARLQGWASQRCCSSHPSSGC